MILIDLFSGIGGFHCGLHKAGFEFSKVYYSDIEKYPCEVYARRYPDAIPLGDITKIDENWMADQCRGEQVIMCGGFPCQDISVAGKMRGLEVEKDGEKEVTRSGLFGEIIRIASMVRPKIMFLENVGNLISGEGGEWMRKICGEISQIGYDCEWTVLAAQEVGAWHKRNRVWIVCYSRGE